MIAGSGIAAAAWAAPSIVRLDVASAAGSLGTTTTIVEPGMVPANVTVFPTATSTINGESTFGRYGNGNGDNGTTVSFADSAPPAHTQVTVTVRICYRTQWEGPDSATQFQDSIAMQVDGGPAPAPFPVSVRITDACVDYSFTVAHSGILDLDVIGNPTANNEKFGVARLTLEYC